MTDHALLCDIRDELRAILLVQREIRDALFEQEAARIPKIMLEPRAVPIVPYEQVAAMMDKPSFTSLQGPLRADDPRSSVDMRYPRYEGPTMGAAITVDASASQPWTPAPGKAGPAWCYPNPTNTPGVPNPNITQDNIASTLAVPGFTATIRPPVSVTRIIKQHIMERDGLTGDPSQWELDHFISLELAGAPLEIGNLWCQPYAPAGSGAHEKDAVENFLHRQIVSGALTIAQAQKLITDDWFAVYLSLHKMGLLPMMVAYDPDGSSDPDDNA